MTQRVKDGLGLPAGLYRLEASGITPTFFAPNGITADGVASIIYANVISINGSYEKVNYDGDSGVFVAEGSPAASPAAFNNEAVDFVDDVLHQIFNEAQPGIDLPYTFEASTSRANIVVDLATLEADFTLSA